MVSYDVVGDCAPGLSSSPTNCSLNHSLSAMFRRGDGNDDGTVNIADGIYILGNLFLMGVPNPLLCVDAADANDDGSVNIADVIALLGALFGTSAVPLLPPYPGCGTDPTADAADCATYTTCP